MLDAGLSASYLGLPLTRDFVFSVRHTGNDYSLKYAGGGIFLLRTSSEQNYESAESVTAAREALVFMVNKNNPVSELSLQQLSDILSGKITNWSEAGGNDEEIKLFSKSQSTDSYMIMKEFFPDSCGFQEKCFYDSTIGKMDLGLSLEYDNSEASLGFTLYSGALNLPEYIDDVKFIRVDGINPDSGSISGGTYPLTVNIDYVYRNSEPENSEVRKFAEFIQSEEGQNAAEKSGYFRADGKYSSNAPVIPDYVNNSCQVRGTGPKKPDDYTLSPKYYSATYDDIEDSDLKAYLRECMDDTEKAAEEKSAELTDDTQYQMYSTAEILNSYAFVTTYLEYTNFDYYFIEQKYIYLPERKYVNFSDLFYEGTDFLSVLNNKFSEYTYEMDYNAFSGFNDTDIRTCRMFIAFANKTSNIPAEGCENNPAREFFDATTFTGNETAFLGYDIFDISPVWQEYQMDGINYRYFSGTDSEFYYSRLYFKENYSQFFELQYLNLEDGFMEFPVRSRIMNEEELKSLQDALLDLYCNSIIPELRDNYEFFSMSHGIASTMAYDVSKNRITVSALCGSYRISYEYTDGKFEMYFSRNGC